jgi:2',3'-cyclic-nucleotide 2'-phosphodiesterase (5'-nucleotidase family)
MHILLYIFLIIFSPTFSDIIDITPYEYPSPIETESEYNIVIMGTNDIHGSYFPSEINLTSSNITYKSGGLQYMGKYINLLREQWGDRFIWLDAGDQFQGAMENTLSNGSIITDFYNIMNLTAATFGNHEWDFGRDFIIKRMNNSLFPYIIGNLQEISSGKKEFLPNQFRSKVIKAGNINVGIIGLTTIQTPITSAQDLSDIDFLDYIKIVEELSVELKKKSDVIVLLCHFGLTCNQQSDEEKYTLRMVDPNMNFSKCSEDSELYTFLKKIKKGLIDVIVSGHTHEIVHQWLFDHPIISSVNNGKYSNLIYLSFTKNQEGKYIYNPEKTLIEGPLPICEKIFEKKLHCKTISEEEIEEVGELKNFQFHNITIEKEELLDNLTNTWEEKVEKYRKEIVTYSDGPLSHNRKGETNLGNLITNIIKYTTKSDISIINSGGFRTSWSEGKISIADIYNMFPFNNYITSFEMNGYEIKRMLKIVQKGPFSFYPTSGDKEIVLVNGNKKNLINVVLFDGIYEKEIINDKNYTIGTLDFCIPNGGDDFVDVISWYKNRKLKYHGDTKDIIIKYLKNVKLIVTKELIDEKNPRLRIIEDKMRLRRFFIRRKNKWIKVIYE